MKYINSTVFALLSQVMPKFSATVLFILLARRTGQAQAGAYALAMSFLSVAILLSSFGLEDMLVREVARNRSLARPYFTRLLGFRFLVNLAALALLWLSVKVFFHYDPALEATILLLSLTLLPESATDLAQSLLVGTGRIRWTAVASTLVSISQFVTGGIVLLTRPQVQSLLVVLVIHSFLGCILNVALALGSVRSDGAPHESAPELPPGFWRQQLRATRWFVVINVFAVLELQMDVMFISVLKTIEEVGVYGSAKTLIASFAIIAQALRIAVYPRLAALYPGNPEGLQALYRRLFRYLAAFSVPLVIGLIIEAPFVVHLIYGQKFAATALPLQVLAVSLALSFLYIPSTRLLIAAHRESEVARLVLISFTINLVGNLVLVPRFGAAGSALARSISVSVYFALCETFVNLRLLRSGSARTLVRATVVALPMAGVMLLVYPIHPVLAAAAGIITYGALMLPARVVEPAEIRALVQEYRSAVRRSGLFAANPRS